MQPFAKANSKLATPHRGKRLFSFALTAGLALVELFLASCAGTGNSLPPALPSSPPPQTVSISVSPNTVSLLGGATHTFTATVTGSNNTAVVWSVDEGALGGSISSAGLYTAPQAGGTFHVRATSVADSTKSDVAAVSVLVVSITISPRTATLLGGATQLFSASVTGSTNTGVIWTVDEGSAGGSVSNSGLYTAPLSAGTYHVRATSLVDVAKSDVVAVTVTVVSISISPRSVALANGATQLFVATVTGTSNTSVLWSVDEGASGGSITSAGLYTAPQTPGTFHVRANSAADSSKSDVASVRVAPPAVAVSISPRTASISSGEQKTFVATVTGTDNPAVTWSVDEGPAAGLINSAGLYVAPYVAGTFHVRATSVADPAVSDVATVVVTVQVSISISPNAVDLPTGGNQFFVATVTGTNNTAITWSVDEGASSGFITTNGRYSAPQITGTFHVRATSAADTTKSAVATVNVTRQVVAVSIAPTSLTLPGGGTQQFAASVTGTSNTAVTWSVDEGSSGGSISNGGLYTAPQASGSFHIRATSVADSSKSAAATVIVTFTPLAVIVSPNYVPLLTGGTQRFTVTVLGTNNSAVSWSVDEGSAGGSITAAGFYTAPQTAGTFHVRATSAADNTKSGMATVIVSLPSVIVSVWPTSITLQPGQTQLFSGSVSGSPNTGVIWSVEEGPAGGSITSNGLYTAPQTTGTFHVRATSAADNAMRAVATVFVAIQGVVVIVLPNSVSLPLGGTQAFTASVGGTSNPAVVWSVDEGPAGGTITSSGLYSAPQTAGTFHVRATSAADSSKSDVATVTVGTQVVSISISPTSVTLLATSPCCAPSLQVFTATVGGSTNTAVTWSVLEAQGGFVTTLGPQTGEYTPPQVPGVYHVLATSQADSTKSATATVNVIVGVDISPPFVNLGNTQTQTFTAYVRGAANQAVTWSILEGPSCGFVTSAGIYTAPSGPASVCHVTATSQADPTKWASATVNVVAVTVSISPQSDTLGPGGVRAFTASVNLSNASVTWSVQEGPTGGSITNIGVYTAPTTLGTYHVVATSIASPSHSAVATITVVPFGFTPTGSLISPRSYHTATLLPNGKVLVAGGDDAGGVAQATVELFDPATGTSSSPGNMTMGRSGHTATLLPNGKVLVAGGFDSYGGAIDTAELFDPAGGSFSATGYMTSPRALHTATLLPNGKVLIAGGYDSYSSIPLAEIFDPATGIFTGVGNMTTGRYSHTAALLPNGKVLMAGGLDYNDQPVMSAELFDPATGTFTPTGNMTTARYRHSATLLPNGTVLLVGGFDIVGFPTSSAELFVPASGTFTLLGSSPGARAWHSATLLSNGKVLIVGGYDGYGVLATAVVFDPASQAFTATGSMTFPRAGHTATLLPSGAVLIIGGSTDTVYATATAEIYH